MRSCAQRGPNGTHCWKLPKAKAAVDKEDLWLVSRLDTAWNSGEPMRVLRLFSHRHPQARMLDGQEVEALLGAGRLPEGAAQSERRNAEAKITARREAGLLAAQMIVNSRNSSSIRFVFPATERRNLKPVPPRSLSSFSTTGRGRDR